MRHAGVMIQCLLSSGWWLLLSLSETKMGVARDLIAREALLSSWLGGLGHSFAIGVLTIFLLVALVLGLKANQYTTLPFTVFLSFIVYYLSKASSLLLLGVSISLLITLIGLVNLLKIGFQEKTLRIYDKDRTFII